MIMENNNQNDKQNQPNLCQQIMEKIKTNGIKMRPKWHFVLGAALWVCGIILAALAAVYFVSLAIFILHRSGIWFAPAFGPRGWIVLFFSLPWLIILAAVVFIILLEIFARRYSFVWRYPLLYSTLFLMLAVVIGGFLTAQTPLHRRLGQNNNMPPLPPPLSQMKPFYENLEQRHRNPAVNIGIITEFNNSGFVMQERHGEELTVIVDSNTKIKHQQDTSFKIGEMLIIFGPRAQNIIKAEAIDCIKPNDIMKLHNDYFSAAPNEIFLPPNGIN